MRKSFAFALVVSMVALGMPTVTLAAGQCIPGAVNCGQQGSPQTGSMQGLGDDADHHPLQHYTVRVRSITNNSIPGTTTTNSQGEFTFTGLKPDTYVAEILDSNGNVVSTSAPTAVAAGQTVSVSLTAATVQALQAGGFSVFGLGSLASAAVVGGAAAGAIAGIIAVKKPASPVR